MFYEKEVSEKLLSHESALSMKFQEELNRKNQSYNLHEVKISYEAMVQNLEVKLRQSQEQHKELLNQIENDDLSNQNKFKELSLCLEKYRKSIAEAEERESEYLQESILFFLLV